MRSRRAQYRSTYDASMSPVGASVTMAPPNKSCLTDMALGKPKSSAGTVIRGCHVLLLASINERAGLGTRSSPFDIMERRRSVMQPTADPYNARSGIPPPSTVSKPGPLSRMSVAGTGMRPPTSMAPPSTNPRHSVMRSSQNQNPLLMSASKPNPNVGRTPMSRCVVLAEAG